MAYGPRVVSSADLLDTSAPGAPAFASEPVQDGKTIKMRLRLPATDADGTELTGLRNLAVVSALGEEFADPFGSATMEELLADAENVQTVIDVSANAPGDEIDVELPALGTAGTQWITAACAD